MRLRIAERRRRVASTMHRRFREIFPEAAGAAGIDTFVDVLLSGLRGLGVARLFGPMPRDCARQIDELARLIELRCAHAAPASPPPGCGGPSSALRRTSPRPSR